MSQPEGASVVTTIVNTPNKTNATFSQNALDGVVRITKSLCRPAFLFCVMREEAQSISPADTEEAVITKGHTRETMEP